MELDITSILGRFHPVLVHLPIGILLLAFLFTLLSRTKRYKKLKPAVRTSLFYGMVSAVIAAASGYYLSLGEDYDEQLLMQHKWMGFATTGLAVVTYLFSRKSFLLAGNDRRQVVTVLFFPLVIVLTLTGHLGGSLTYGEDFLFESSARLEIPDSVKMQSRKRVVANVEEAKVYDDIIKPLLEEKCYKCHSSKKQKGQLRLDATDLIQKGGKHGEVFVAGDPAESELFKRITFSIEMKEHMPPRRESQLTDMEIELIRWWITEGASFDKQVKQLPLLDELNEYLKTLSSPTPQSWVPGTVVGPPDKSAIEELQSSGIALVPVEVNSNYVSVSFAGKKGIDESDLKLLKLLAEQIIELNLAWTSVSDDQLAVISELKAVRRLHLEHTEVTDLGVTHLKSCENLVYLNLVDTKISNDALATVTEMKSLKELYVFNTRVTKAGLLMLNPQIKVDTGRYQLQKLVTDTLVYRAK
ncbi:MAG: c-type cytochrome domain-containing protein [Bacteroidota bacterium]